MTDYNFPAKATKAAATELRNKFGYDHNFWRAVPPEQWDTFAGVSDLDWWSRTIGFARGLVKTGTISIVRGWTPAEMDALFELAVSGKPGIDVHYGSDRDAVDAFVARATTDAHAVALDASCSLFSAASLFGSFASPQIRAIKRVRMIADTKVTAPWQQVAAAKTRRWYFIAHEVVTPEEWAAIAPLKPSDIFEVPYDAPPALVAGVRKNLEGVRASVRQWVTDHALAHEHLFSSDDSSTLTKLLLWASSLESVDDAFIATAAALLQKDKYLARARDRERAAPRVATALLAAPDSKGVVAKLRKGTKAKAAHALLDDAEARLVTNLGLAGSGEVSWSAMDADAGGKLIASQADAPAAIAGWLENADGNATLRIFIATAMFLVDRGNKGKLGEDPWTTVSAILQRLERTVGPDLPSEMERKGWGVKQATDAYFAWGYEAVERAFMYDTFVHRPRPAAEVKAALKAMHASSTNERFRGLLAGVLGEPFVNKLERLAAACAGHKAGTVARWFAARTDDAPGPTDINRLYGSPIGVSATMWPRGQNKQPMQHILTLETRALTAEVRADLGDAAAIAVFLADIDEPNGEYAIVELSRDNLSSTADKPLVEPTLEGVRLELHEIELPKAVFQGGKKAGTLKELRTALDQLEGVLSTDRTSARWIQQPEPRGALIAQLESSFAPKLNFGDSGAIYVMTGGLVFQCY